MREGFKGKNGCLSSALLFAKIDLRTTRPRWYPKSLTLSLSRSFYTKPSHPTVIIIRSMIIINSSIIILMLISSYHFAIQFPPLHSMLRIMIAQVRANWHPRRFALMGLMSSIQGVAGLGHRIQFLYFYHRLTSTLLRCLRQICISLLVKTGCNYKRICSNLALRKILRRMFLSICQQQEQTGGTGLINIYLHEYNNKKEMGTLSECDR